MTTDLIARAERLAGFAAQDPDNAALLLDLAATRHQAGQHGHALAALNRASSVEPGLGGLAPLRGQVLLALGQWDEAQAVFEAALAAEPGSAALLFNTGYSAWAAGHDLDRAAALMGQASDLDPGDPRLKYFAALAYDEVGAPTKARSLLAQALDIDADHPESLVYLSRLCLDAGETPEARALAERCVASHPDVAAGWQLKGDIAMFDLDADAASVHLRRALELAPDDNDIALSLAQSALMRGRVREAQTLLQRVVQRDATHAQAYSMLGWALAATAELDASRDAFSAAAAADASAAEPLAGLGSLALAQGRVDEAERHCAAALALEPDNPLTGLLRSRIDEVQGHPELAQARMRKALGSTPFGASAPNFAAMIERTSHSTAAKRLQRRFTRTARARVPRSPA